MEQGASHNFDCPLAASLSASSLAMNVLPHVGQNTSGRSSAVPPQRKRKLIEKGFGWAKTVGGIRHVIVRGIKALG